LVSEIMLQQTQVPRVVSRYAPFLQRFPTLMGLAAASLADVLAQWSGLGYNNRAQRLRRCAQQLVADAHDQRPALPTTVAELERLPGIGRYTARAIMVFAHNADVAAVDANVRRVLIHELGLPPDLTLDETQNVASVVLPHGRSRDWHNALMDYGSAVLTAHATGIAPLTTQTPFAGSRRYYRAALIRLLLAQSPRHLSDLATALDLPPTLLVDLVAALHHDGLVLGDDEQVWLG
ncbi:MAG: Fe-S cluster assembly protein HesB, partial [Thermoleophilia bacterium]